MNYPSKALAKSGLMDADLRVIDGTLVSHNVWVSGHRTSVRLEPVMWQALQDICGREHMTMHELVTVVAGRRSEGASLTASLRAFIVAYLRAVASRERPRHSNVQASQINEPASLRA